MDNLYLAHHGILGQKWGVRRFQNEDGTLTKAGQKRYSKLNKKMETSAKSAINLYADARNSAQILRESSHMLDDVQRDLFALNIADTLVSADMRYAECEKYVDMLEKEFDGSDKMDLYFKARLENTMALTYGELSDSYNDMVKNGKSFYTGPKYRIK